MAQGFFTWSHTAASNASASDAINWQENQAPSSINDSARAQMAETAKWRDDISGATVTTGTSAAYSLTTFSNFTSAAYMANQLVAFTPHVTNAAGPVTMTVDSQANIPLRSSPNTELLPGVLIAGTSYVCVYNNTDHALYLQNFYGNPYNVPLGAGMDFWGLTVPNSSFAFPIGQQISQTAYATLYALFGSNKYGPDGGGLFYLPDKTERVSVMKAAAASRLTATYFGGNSTVLGAVGGGESHLLTTSEIPSHVHGNTLTDPGHSHTYQDSNVNTGGGGTSVFIPINQSTQNTSASVTGIVINNAAQGGGAAHAIVQPTIVTNYIIRVL
jgi:microcystin-dependent protein